MKGQRDESLRSLGFKSYDDYLESQVWKNLKRELLAGDVKCCVCERKRAKTLHHTSYDSETLSGDSRKHLHPICEGCHRRIHFDTNGKFILGSCSLKRLQDVCREKAEWRAAPRRVVQRSKSKKQLRKERRETKSWEKKHVQWLERLKLAGKRFAKKRKRGKKSKVARNGLRTRRSKLPLWSEVARLEKLTKPQAEVYKAGSVPGPLARLISRRKESA